LENEKSISMKKEIICFHFLNNYSGSPFILSLVIRAFIDEGHRVTLYTSKGKGFLSDNPDIKYKFLMYEWKLNKIWLSFLFILTQLQLFLSVLLNHSFKKKQIFYINTILPFGAAIAGWLLRLEIIYHVHEHYVNPNLMQKIALKVMQFTADKVIFVSNYLQKTISVKQHNIVLTNSLSFEFINISDAYLLDKRETNRLYNNILMVSSLKVYKGVLIFLELARKLPEYEFCLVAGSDHKEVLNFIKAHNPPKNFIIYSAQSNLHPFYQNADILVNLTIPSYCIESFGLTILEGMAYGLPIIAPPAGGPTEIVIDGENGYLINASDMNKLISSIRNLSENPEIYNNFSNASLRLSKNYNYVFMKNQLLNFI